MFSIENFSQQVVPNWPFEDIKNKILGSDYNLSLVFVGEKKSKSLNNKYRRKNTPTNILSFPLEKKWGEIIITPLIVKKRFPKPIIYQQRILHLFIHGCLHLKGMTHSSKMELEEDKLIKVFK